MTQNSQKEIIKMAGTWELGWNTPIKEIELWEYPLREFAVDKFYMTPVSGISSQFITEKGTFEEIIYENNDLEIVFVDEKGKTLLNDFTHPKKVLYIFGKASFSPMAAYAKPDDLSVRIETPLDSGMLWPHQAACILLYDRIKKSWQ